MSGAFIIIVLGLLFVSFWVWLDHKQEMAKQGLSPERDAALEELQARLERAEAERARLTERVQNLEAIVTTETFDLARENPAAAAARLELPEEPEETPAERTERLARRVRP